MLSQDQTSQAVDVQTAGPATPVHRHRFRVAILVACVTIGLGACVSLSWAVNNALQPIRLLEHATRYIDAADRATPIRSRLGISPEVAPLCPQPEVNVAVDTGRNRFPIRTRLLKRLGRAPE